MITSIETGDQVFTYIHTCTYSPNFVHSTRFWTSTEDFRPREGWGISLMYELCAPVFCCSAGHTVGDHVGKTWFRISLHNKSSKKSAFQSTMEHLTYLDIRDTFALIMVRPLEYTILCIRKNSYAGTNICWSYGRNLEWSDIKRLFH